MDIFAPCALGAILHDRSIPELGAKIVAGSANNQLGEARHGEMLRQRGLLYAPDYVINAGGLIDIYVESQGGDQDAVLDRTAQIYETSMTIFERAAQEEMATDRVADRMAEERFNRRHGTRVAA